MCRRVFASVLFLVMVPILIAQNGNDKDAVDLFRQGMSALIGSSQNRDYLASVDLFRKSARMGYAPAQVALGYLHETGGFMPRDTTEALKWYKDAAQQDDSLAEWLAGRLIYAGLTSMRDLNEAAAWFRKSAGHDDPFGSYLLGMVSLERQKYSEAAESFESAAKQGLPQAQYQLAILLRDGLGVKQDKFEAYVWLLVSSDSGYEVKPYDLQFLESDLGSTSVKKAKAKAQEFEAEYARSVVARGCTGWAGEFDRIPAPPPIDVQRFCR